MIISVIIWQVAAAMTTTVIVHEAGHLLGAYAVGLTPRVAYLGIGPRLWRLRWGTLVCVVRAVPITGYILVEPEDRRAALAIMLAAGPLANIGAMALCLWLHDIRPDWDFVVAMAIFQGLFAVAALTPSTGKAAGIRAASDGLRLYRLARRGKLNDAAVSYASVMSNLAPKGAPVHPMTRHTKRIMFEIVRPDRFVDASARKEACASLEALLSEIDLSRPERGLILCFLCSMEFLYGSVGASPATLDTWSREALALCPEPVSLAARGEALMAAGQLPEAETLLRQALAGYEARDEATSPLVVIGRASLALALALTGRTTEAQTLFDEVDVAPASAQPQVRELIDLLKARAFAGSDAETKPSR